MKAEYPTWPTGLFARLIALLRKSNEIGAPKNERINTCDRLKAVLVPLAHGARGGAGRFRSFANVIGLQALDAAYAVPPVRHAQRPKRSISARIS